MYCGVLYAPSNVVMGQLVCFFYVSHAHCRTRVLQATHTTVHTSATVRKRKHGGGESSNVWAKAFYNADENGRLVVVHEAGVTRKGQPGQKEVDRITCLVCRRNVSYSRASLNSAIAHLKTHHIYSADDATDSLLRLVHQYASSEEPLPPKFYPKPVMASTTTKDRARTHTLADFGMQPTASTGANTVLGRRFKRAAAMWVAAASLPYSITDHPAFHSMCRVLDPTVPKIGRKALTTQVMNACKCHPCCSVVGYDWIGVCWVGPQW